MRTSGIQDITSSNGNLPLFDLEKKQEKIGSQVISIPIAIGKQEKSENKITLSTAVCKTSGCTFQILVDEAILGLKFKWESPLASRENSLQIANLRRTEMVQLSAEILAGTAISLLSSKDLLVGKSSSQSVNQYLVASFTKEQLVENIIRIKKIIETKSNKELPLLSKDSFDRDSFQGYLTSVSLVLFPTENRIKEVPVETVILRTRRKKIAEVFDLSDEDEITSEVRKDSGNEKQTAVEMLQEWLKARDK